MSNQIVPAVINSNGNMVGVPVYFYGKTPDYVGCVAKNEVSNPSDKVEFEFAPSKDFVFKFSKDADCNIDIWIHTNPKNICKDIANAFSCLNKVKKYL